ncbi:MAG: hypothetical protein Q8904_04030 [Bacteroidota bacterium]|nr:hypothetical protein [Bacteroidota bacterium]
MDIQHCIEREVYFVTDTVVDWVVAKGYWRYQLFKQNNKADYKSL